MSSSLEWLKIASSNFGGGLAGTLLLSNQHVGKSVDVNIVNTRNDRYLSALTCNKTQQVSPE